MSAAASCLASGCGHVPECVVVQCAGGACIILCIPLPVAASAQSHQPGWRASGGERLRRRRMQPVMQYHSIPFPHLVWYCVTGGYCWPVLGPAMRVIAQVAGCLLQQWLGAPTDCQLAAVFLEGGVWFCVFACMNDVVSRPSGLLLEAQHTHVCLLVGWFVCCGSPRVAALVMLLYHDARSMAPQCQAASFSDGAHRTAPALGLCDCTPGYVLLATLVRMEGL